MLGKTVTVTVDLPLGTCNPGYSDTRYNVNYGYIEGICAPDGEWQDAYILGVNEPVAAFTGKVAAVIRRRNDGEEKWVVCPESMFPSKEETARAVDFCERYFDSEIIM